MKKFVVLMMAIFLVFPIDVFSRDRTHITVQSAKIEQPQKRNAKSGRKLKKTEPKKRIHKSGIKRYKQKKTGTGIKL